LPITVFGRGEIIQDSSKTGCLGWLGDTLCDVIFEGDGRRSGYLKFMDDDIGGFFWCS